MVGKQPKEPRRWRQHLPRIAAYAVPALVLIAVVVWHFVSDARSLTLSELEQHVRDGRVVEAEFARDENFLQVKLQGERGSHTVDYPEGIEGDLYRDLKAAGVARETEGVSLLSVLTGIASAAIWIFLLIMLLSLVTSMSSLRKFARQDNLDTGEVERPDTRFDDVQGIDEIVARAREIAEILHDPERFRKLGARLPKGAILYGPPGTGKTLLARAIAGEAEVPFYRVAAASLMDKWLGSSAKRISQLYANARSHEGGAIVFIDEVDAIGGHRGSRAGGADGERNAALTQLLNELDGFEKHNVFTIVATNRLDTLDAALTRAGRFDIQLMVPPPGVNGREAILKLHTRNKPLAGDVDLRQIAQHTTGAVGADLEALANEAALTAARGKSELITSAHFHEALATIENGPQRKGVIVSDAERRTTAYHEAGHALAAQFQEIMDDPMRVTIVPRGVSGGHTRVSASEDRQFVSKQFAKAQLVWMMAGRAAEKIACGADNFTSGAAGDLQQATAHALRMVCQWGMGTYNTSIPLDTWEDSPQAAEVERQVEELLDEAETVAIDLLIAHHDALQDMVTRLLEEETLQDGALRRFADYAPLHGDELERVRERYSDVLGSVRIGGDTRTLVTV